MDYEAMLLFHKHNNADVTIAALPVPMEEASRFGIVVTDDNDRIVEFEEKPENPKSNLASMGIYIFNFKKLRQALIELKDQPGCDFGKHVIPWLHQRGNRIFAYEFNGYWKDVGTLGSYWEANMELIDIIPEFNLYEEYWKIYTKQDRIEPQLLTATAKVHRALIGAGDTISGEVSGSVLGSGVTVGEGSIIRDSIIMKGVKIGKDVIIEKAIIAEDCVVGDGAKIGMGEEAESQLNPNIYAFGLATIGEKSVIPAGVTIGKNTAIKGVTTEEDYKDHYLPSGGFIIKKGEA